MCCVTPSMPTSVAMEGQGPAEGDGGVRGKSRASGASPGTALRSGRGGASPGHGDLEFAVEAGGGGGDDTEAPGAGVDAAGERTRSCAAIVLQPSMVFSSSSSFYSSSSV
jgi:hypothetical protein